MQHATGPQGEAQATAVTGRNLEMPRFVQVHRLNGRADEQAQRVARTGLGKTIDRLADTDLWIAAAAHDRTVEMEFDAITHKRDRGNLPADQLVWLFQQRIPAPCSIFVLELRSGA